MVGLDDLDVAPVEALSRFAQELQEDLDADRVVGRDDGSYLARIDGLFDLGLLGVVEARGADDQADAAGCGDPGVRRRRRLSLQFFPLWFI